METQPIHPTLAVRMVDNWDGEGNIVTLFAFEKDGELFDYNNCKPLIQYVGDKIIQKWPLATNTQR